MAIVNKQTHWDKSSRWYDALVGDRGQYYHEHVIIPGALRLLDLKADSRLLDIGCGQGILGRAVPAGIRYTGVDASRNLISQARRRDRNSSHDYLVADATRPLPVAGTFTQAAMILSLQNLADSRAAIANTAMVLADKGNLIIVLNHPVFRIPRQSAWGTDETNKLQFRKIFRYLSPLKIPISTHPGQNQSPVTWSYHQPLSAYSRDLKDAGLAIALIEEWASDRESIGKAARMENRARSEIPLFMAIRAIKL
jgi:SAM-dependent methyltransferase